MLQCLQQDTGLVFLLHIVMVQEPQYEVSRQRAGGHRYSQYRINIERQIAVITMLVIDTSCPEAIEAADDMKSCLYLNWKSAAVA